MSLRFRRSLRLLPGVRLNLGKRGASVSVGVRGAHVTVGRTGTRTTVGIPGTGLSYTELHRPAESPAEAQDDAPARASSVRGFIWFALAIAVVIAVVASNLG